MCKYQQVNVYSNVVKYVRPIYGNKKELAPLRLFTGQLFYRPQLSSQGQWRIQDFP